MYKSLIRPLLFKLAPEKAHHFTFGMLRFLFALPFVRSIFYFSYNINHRSLEREVFGIRFKNPVGLAAGFDKDGKLFNQLGFMGFGFIEVGTVTPKAQTGNPQPRLFRLPEDSGLINRMGFNNQGVDKLRNRLRRKYATVVIGGNIGKNKLTPNENAVDDYLHCFETLYDAVDYFAVNVSSPNTPNLRELQEKEPLTKLLKALVVAADQKPVRRPILLKIAPDLTDSQLDDIVNIVRETGIDGVIATNTTISRKGLNQPIVEVEAIGAGGLSGKPVRARSTEVIRYLYQKSGGAFPIIGVGGIHSADDAMEKLEAGASLVQLYTGYIYEGPALVRQINKKIIAHAANR
jgi:dihydroorotate dehydrogenase